MPDRLGFSRHIKTRLYCFFIKLQNVITDQIDLFTDTAAVLT